MRRSAFITPIIRCVSIARYRAQTLITRSMFPAGGAGDYSYAESLQLYGPYYQMREPRKTFRLTVSTTF